MRSPGRGAGAPHDAHADALHFAVVTALAGWLAVVACAGRRDASLWILVSNALLVALAARAHPTPGGRRALAPLLAWLLLAATWEAPYGMSSNGSTGPGERPCVGGVPREKTIPSGGDAEGCAVGFVTS